MYYNNQYNDGAPGLLGDPMAMQRGDDFGYNQAADFGRGDVQFSGGGGNLYNSYDNFDDRVGYTDSLSNSGGYSQLDRSYDSMSYNMGLGAPGLQTQPNDLQDNMNFYRQDSHSLPDAGMDYNQPRFEERNFSFASEGDALHEVGFESRRDSVKDVDRERDRDRNRRSHGRDRQRNTRRDDNFERSNRRDRGDKDWTNGDRDRRREKRTSRERSIRERSPRDDGSMELSNDSPSRMEASEEDVHSSGSPGRDRHRDWDRSRQDPDHERDRERDRDRHRDRDRDRSRSRDDRERDRDRDRGDREGERWMTEEPSATILLRGLNNSVVENDVIQELIRIGMPPKDVRFMRRVTGASRGFGFVEFQSQSEAQRWMDLNQGQLQLPDAGQRVSMHYSAPRVSRDSRDQPSRMDWMCKCGAHNFKRRDFCYKCNTNRRLAEDPLCGVTELDPATHVGKSPCNTLLFRDLDALTTEQGVLQAIAALTSMAIKNTQVIRDDLNTSLCFAFLELNSVASAKQLHDFLQVQSPPLAIDGKQVMVSFAKNTFNTSLDIISKAQQKLQQNQYYLNYSNYYGQGSDSNGQYYNYSQYYGTDTAATATTDATPPANSTNAAAAVAQTAIMQAQAAKTLATSSTAITTAVPETTSTTTSQYPVYPPPDVTKYQYDKTSGYYYDPTTGLYYEPNTQYYFNAKTTQWMYWDAEKSTYLPAPTQGTESGQSTETDPMSQEQTEKNEKEEKKEKEKTKVAKKIAKDMEKWAKAMNAQKDAIKEEHRKNTGNSGRKESAAADAGFAILQKSKEDMKLMPPPPLSVNPAPEIAVPAASAAGGSKAGLVASYGGDSDDSGDEDDGGVVDESKLVDWSKLACLLCKRQFQSREILTKHTQFSDLHKQNLEKLKAKASAGKVEKKEYRDRAKERRQKYGTPAPPEPRKQAVGELPEVYEQPTKAGIGADNIGNKMLQKMGWSAGLGLGKSSQGITAPIETQRRAATAGLGARGANIVAEEGATYKENVKKTLFARYNEPE